ncbi:MAG: ATPase, T2SS/T4P/T4SS family [candidate division KSB1 bacterium]|nr:ATPase, T2SS/T4P/T4SS family [candidate division KSB1 bacterium]
MIENIFKNIIEQIPVHIEGVERQRQMSQIVQQLPQNELEAIREHFQKITLFMRQQEASDIEVGGPMSKDAIWFRIHGRKTPQAKLGKWSLDHSDILCHAMLDKMQINRLLDRGAVDFSYSITQNEHLLRWRATVYFDLGHLALNMRAIEATVYPFSQLGFHKNVARSLSLLHEKQGLILITGITGSGKSTTMDSIVDANNQSVDGHIVIIGDPIEYVHTSKRCLVRHREVGRDVIDFKQGAVQALRQDPDIIIVGEMRDPETILSCLEISDTGHKVFSTLHTGSAVETIDRIVAECQPEEQDRVRVRLADQLRVAVSQKLVPNRKGKRTLAKEVLLVNSSVKAAIRNKNVHEIYQMISESGKNGMITMEQDLFRLYQARRNRRRCGPGLFK